MPTEKALSLQDEKDIICEYIEATSDSEVETLLKRHKLTQRALNGMLRANTPLLQELFNTKCSVDVYKENKLISEIKANAFTYLLDQVLAATNSENSLAYLDKITKMVETIDKIDRLNRNQATENIQTTSQTTTTTVNISDLMKQLSTPEEKKNFLLKRMEDLKFNKE
jgi:hypothetical protein